MAVRLLRLAGWLGGAALGCARIQPPPGGPEDRAPPILVGIRPDSVRSLPDFDGEVEFRFDEVISEGSAPNMGLGTGDLERLVLLSPSPEVPVVRWRRSRITVRPREGWRPNTVYRVELLAGVRDLRNNAARGSVVVTFTTGTELPGDSLYGRVVDWATARPVARALVEATLLPDSLVYRTTADSSGRFVLGPLPGGAYLVRGIIDQNANRRLDPRESFDSLRIGAGSDSVGELWAFRHDSTPPRLQQLTAQDSVSFVATFTQSLDPYQRLDPDSVRVLALPDSTPVPVEAALPKTAYDSAFAPRPDTTAADSARRADTARAAPQPQPVRPPVGARRPEPRDPSDTGPLSSRPALYDRLTVRVGTPLGPGVRYWVEFLGVRTVSGVSGSTSATLGVPDRQPTPDTTAARRDTTRPPPPRPPPPASPFRPFALP